MGYTVAHILGAEVSAALRAHPAIGDVIEMDPAARFTVPAEADVFLAVHGRPGAGMHNVPPPPSWPGRLKLAQIASAGIDDYPDWLFDAPVVASAGGANAGPIAEFVLALMLTHERRLPGVFVHAADAWTPHGTVRPEANGTLDGKTLGLVGLGQIATRIAALARAFGMRVIATRRSRAPAPDDAIKIGTLDDVLAAADHLVLAAPLTPETLHIIGRAALSRVKPSLHLVNISRGGLLDQEALLAALDGGRLAAASLDVTDPEPLPDGHPLYSHSRVRISPHIAWHAPGVAERSLALFFENLRRLGTGETLINEIARNGRLR